MDTGILDPRDSQAAPGQFHARVNPHLWNLNYETDLRDNSYGMRFEGDSTTLTGELTSANANLVSVGGQVIGTAGGKSGIDPSQVVLTPTGLTVNGVTGAYDIWVRYTKVA